MDSLPTELLREAQRVKNLLAMQENQGSILGSGRLLEKEMAIHSSILAWEIPWTEVPGDYSPWGHKESDMTEQLNNNTVAQYSF